MFDQHPDAAKWNQRYQNSERPIEELPEACGLLQAQQHLLPKQGVSLDLACGLGGNALFLATTGLQSHAWDISKVALEQLDQFAQHHRLEVCSQLTDLKAHSLPVEAFDCIVVSYYLDRRLCAAIEKALKPKGLLFYQTFALDKVSNKGPSRPAFLLKNNELPTLFPNLILRYYQHLGPIGDLNQGDHDTVQMVAQKA